MVAFNTLQSLDVSLDYADCSVPEHILASRLETVKLSRAWCTVRGEDTSLWKGVSFGSIAALDVQWSVREIIRKIDVIRRFFSDHHPDAVLVATDENRLIDKIIHSMGYQGDLLIISPSVLQQIKALRSFDFWIQRLRFWSWDWATRVFLSMLSAPFLRSSRGSRSVHEARVLVVSDIPTPSITKAIFSVVKGLRLILVWH
jgi:hypothetical protein